MDAALSEALKRGNPVVFLDVAIGGAPAGRLRLELFKKDCPKTVENFRCVFSKCGALRCFWRLVLTRFWWSCGCVGVCLFASVRTTGSSAPGSTGAG